MSSGKNRRSYSLKTKLIIPMSGFFLLFTLVVSLVAFYIFSSSVTSNSMSEIKSSSEQLITNFDTYFSSVISVSNSVENKIDNFDIMSNKDKLGDYFDNIISVKGDITSISFYDKDMNLISSSNQYVDNYKRDSSWFLAAENEPLLNNFTKVETYDYLTYTFVLSKMMSFNKDTNEGVLRVQFSFQSILSLISNTNLGTGGHVTFYDKDTNVVYSSSNSVTSKELEVADDLVFGMTTFNDGGSSYALFLTNLPNTSWRVGVFTNNDYINETLKVFEISIFSSAAALIILFSILIVFISKSLTSPLVKLEKEMAQIENFNYDITKQEMIKGSKEVESLDRSFIQMLNRIKELMQKVVQEDEEKRKAELKALQNQINPHFLYNTLDSIICLIDKGNNEDAEKMIIALSKFFRISISKGKNIIPLNKEIEHAENYLIIQKIRFGDEFSYKINVQEGMEKYFVIKLILQPLIENAINHGISENNKDSMILINAYVKDGFIYLEVIDNGFGILPQKIDEIYASFKDEAVFKGVGLKNVYQRIKIFYGEKADLIIESELDKMTKVTIKLPEEGALKDEE